MKKIYTLVAATLLAFGANAQEHDFSISWETLTNGSTYTTSPLDISFTITNESDVTVPTGDSLFVSYARDGVAVNVNNLNNPGAQYILLEEDLAPGASLGPYGFTEAGFPTGFNEDFCAVVYGIGVISLSEVVDANPDDNTACIVTDITEGYDVGIEDLESAFGNVYVNANQLVIVNEGVTVDEQANLKIINMNGQTVQVENFTIAQGTSMIEIGDLAPGIYVVAIEVGSEMITRKVSIQ